MRFLKVIYVVSTYLLIINSIFVKILILWKISIDVLTIFLMSFHYCNHEKKTHKISFRKNCQMVTYPSKHWIKLQIRLIWQFFCKEPIFPSKHWSQIHVNFRPTEILRKSIWSENLQSKLKVTLRSTVKKNGDPQVRVFIFITWYKGEPAWTHALEGPHVDFFFWLEPIRVDESTVRISLVKNSIPMTNQLSGYFCWFELSKLESQLKVIKDKKAPSTVMLSY